MASRTLSETGNAANELSDARSTLRAGVARADITTAANGALIKDPLYAKVLVLDDGATRVVLVTMDTTAIGGRRISRGALDDVGEDFLPRLRARIGGEFDIPGEHVLVSASHTHPPGRLLCSDDEQVNRTFAAVRRALETMTPATVGSGLGHEDRITIHRTLRLKDGKAWSIRHTNPCPPDEDVAGVGPIDPEIGILRLDRLDGRPLAVVYNFACHPLFGDAPGSVTANFPGVASALIEETLGHDAVALFLQGAGGNICDVLFKDFGRPRNVEPLGTLLGLSTLKALRGIETRNADLQVISAAVALPRRTDIPERIEALLREQAELLESLRSTSLNFKAFLPLYIQYALSPDFPLDYSYRYLQAEKIGSGAFPAMDAVNRQQLDKYLENIHAMEKLARIRDKIATLEKHEQINRDSGEATVATEVQGIRIGDAVLITSPAELLVEIGLNLKKLSPFEHTLVAAFANGYVHYGPPAADYDAGGYEVTECLLAPEWQPLYETKAAEILHRLR